ncbi:MAG: chorismate mutase [Methanosarcina thermophila]|uniref:Chorismate mutase n=3 Tax=Methanosarcina thermophila TaxID=2210 RepID=A0A1I6Y505_METTE|nr:chorismate mutase [Methanosarcina thermophila]ALK05878.1 MAG: chorismate mutase [Methanosarcina sp. 795]AKB12601.1 Chorismate mutase I [Methanosarcina thermophila TM-1]AKB16746.1 Chorismate mutase I [Methanosarcina thermophila CHTI-55]NLU56673.1 chorismate mutase [Methanosarcina thermophila]SFT45578.1 chorismate mutase [Methanosarcina thermophila]
MSELEAVRKEIEEIDREILALINKRVNLAEKVLESKRINGTSINDQRQNEVVINRALNAATELNLDLGSIKAIFEILIKMSIERQNELSGKGSLP